MAKGGGGWSEVPEDDDLLEDNDLQVCEELYDRLIDTTEKILEILKDQRDKRNLRWAKGIENNFKPMEKMLSEITLYKRRRTMPRTFKDHSCNTLFFNWELIFYFINCIFGIYTNYFCNNCKINLMWSYIINKRNCF